MLSRIAVLLAVQYALLHHAEAGCGCSVCTPCAMPPPCPPPIICPPPACAPPPPCPVPIPEPCPVCVQPIRRPVPVEVPQAIPEEVPEPIPVPMQVNTCCSTCATPCSSCVNPCTTCASPCGYGRKRRSAILGDHLSVPENFTDPEPRNDPVCNNQVLRKIMEKEMTSDITASQLTIQKMAEAQLGGQYHVLCAQGDLAYTVYSKDYCQYAKNDLACYAFKAINTLIMWRS